MNKLGHSLGLKIFLFLFILGGGVYLLNKFPDYSILIIGLVLILLIGAWLKDMADENERTS